MSDTIQSSFHTYAADDAPHGKNAYRIRIGRMFQHKDGKGFDLPLNALPIHGTGIGGSD